MINKLEVHILLFTVSNLEFLYIFIIKPGFSTFLELKRLQILRPCYHNRTASINHNLIPAECHTIRFILAK